MLLYNFGRIMTYSFLGLLVGLIGRGIFYSGLQQYFSILLGGILVLLYVLKLMGNKNYFNNVKAFNFIYVRLSAWIARAGIWNKFTTGMLNGFLPCGLVFLAAANALVQPNVEYGVLYMALFGLGTIPLMLATLMIKTGVVRKFRFSFSKTLPYIGILIGALMILRGLELGVPFLSPAIEYLPAGGRAPSCR